MGKTSNIERNKLDYILTDILPVELSELYSLNKFYDYLVENQTELNKVIEEIQHMKAEGNRIMFEDKWPTIPLKYNILKGVDSTREINLLQPLSILNIFLFIECYQKEILTRLEENAVYSLRYHKKNTDLYYKKRVNKASQYFGRISEKIDKGILQQTGAYYKIKKFNSVASFTNSRIWQQCNFKYKHYAKADYKSCFGSIYTHTYKWIIERNVIDSKNAKNSNLYITIDRILQNINGRSSNGLIVGPEFSRMIAELLLQQIDCEVKMELKANNKENGVDYRIFRYVDDIFIFANSPEEVDLILKIISSNAQKYLLYLNELKLYKGQTPVVQNRWISKTRELAEKVSNLFYSKQELTNLDSVDKHLLKDIYISTDRIKNDFTFLISEFPQEQRYIVSFLLSTLLNNISNKKDGFNIFKEGRYGRAIVLLELALYIYSFNTCFDHTQKLISMIVYINDEVDFINDESNNKKLKSLIRRYSFIFKRGNLNDLCNWFAIFYEYKISLTSDVEKIIENNIEKEDNPILWANYLIYSRYHEPYFNEILSKIEKVICNEISKITNDEKMLQKEFWYVIIFNNCPYLSQQLMGDLGQVIASLRFTTPAKPLEKLTNLLCDFMDQSKPNQFFCWGYYRFNMSKQITFRTYERTLFKQYKNRRSLEMYGSLET